MNILKRSASFSLIIGLAFLLSLQFTSCARSSESSVSQISPYNIPNGMIPANNVVYVSVWVADMFGYDYKDGRYTLDFGVQFWWSDKNLTTFDWYLLNGYPVTPNSKKLVSSNETGGIRTDFYIVEAIFDVDVVPKLYPFDTVKLPIKIEALANEAPLTLVWLESASGINSDFVEVGWNFKGLEFNSYNQTYSYDFTLPVAEMSIVLERSTYSAIYGVIIPPIIFAIVSAFSFAFKVEDDSAFGIRIGLNTSMLITAVLFNLAQADKMPPITEFNAYAIFTISILVFISMNLITTIIGYMAWKYKEDHIVVRTINRLGLFASFLVPFLLFAIIYLASYV